MQPFTNAHDFLCIDEAHRHVIAHTVLSTLFLHGALPRHREACAHWLTQHKKGAQCNHMCGQMERALLHCLINVLGCIGNMGGQEAYEWKAAHCAYSSSGINFRIVLVKSEIGRRGTQCSVRL